MDEIMNDNNSPIDVARRFANGLATREDLDAARYAARRRLATEESAEKCGPAREKIVVGAIVTAIETVDRIKKQAGCTVPRDEAIAAARAEIQSGVDTLRKIKKGETV